MGSATSTYAGTMMHMKSSVNIANHHLVHVKLRNGMTGLGVWLINAFCGASLWVDGVQCRASPID